MNVSLTFVHSMTRIQTIFILLFFFVVSVIVRLPKISRSDYTTNECHIFLLNTMKIWKERGMADCHFSPIQTYSNQGDKNMNYFPRLVSPSGDNYYVSYPPFTFIFTYALFKLLMTDPGVFSLSILNFILHFISALLVFLIVKRKMGDKGKILNLAAVSAFVIYLFVPVMLELHSFIFFPEMLGQVLLLLNIYFVWRLIENPEKFNKRYFFLLGIFNFFLVYTEWIGLFYALTVLIICFRRRSRNYSYRNLSFTVLLSTAASLFLTILQYSSIGGAYHLARSLALRFAMRSGYMPKKYSEEKINIFSSGIFQKIFDKTNFALYLFVYFAAILIVFFALKNKKKIRPILAGNIDFILLLILPVLLHLVLFFNFTLLHNHSFAKLCIPLSIGTAGLAGNILETKASKISFFLAVIFMGLCSSFFYLRYYPGDRASDFLILSSGFIKKNISTYEAGVLKIMSKDELPDVVYLGFYTGRNLVQASNIEEAKQIGLKAGQYKIAYFYLDQISGEKKVEHVVFKN